MHITHDLHTHNLFSGCCYDPLATVENCIRKAVELEHRVLGISNHLWDEEVPGASKWYQGQPISYGLEMKAAIPEHIDGGLKVLFGVETEYCAKSDLLGMRAESAKVFDYVLVPHTHTHMKNFVIAETEDETECKERLKQELEQAYPMLSKAAVSKMVETLQRSDMLPLITDPKVDYEAYLTDFMTDSFVSLLQNPAFRDLAKTVPTIIAHPFTPTEPLELYLRILRRIDRDKLWQCCKDAAEMNVAFDVNVWTFKMKENLENDPMVEIFRIAKDAGVKFTFGTDSHSVVGLEQIRLCDAISEAIGIEKRHLAEVVARYL